MIRVLLVFCVCLAGCVVPGDSPEGGFPAEVSDTTRAYVRDLAGEAEGIAKGMDAGDVATNQAAFERFQNASRHARERFNASLGQALDRRSPPAGRVDPEAWRELAAGLRSSVDRGTP